jgi:hypothetical protein
MNHLASNQPLNKTTIDEVEMGWWIVYRKPVMNSNTEIFSVLKPIYLNPSVLDITIQFFDS